jgi:hypothetical protein
VRWQETNEAESCEKQSQFSPEQPATGFKPVPKKFFFLALTEAFSLRRLTPELTRRRRG